MAKSKKGGGKRLWLKSHEVNFIEELRAIDKASKDSGLDPDTVKHGWIKSEGSSLFFTNPNYKVSEQNAFVKDLIKSLESHSPKYDKIKRTPSKDDHLMVVSPADVHIGKLASSFETGEDYNSNIAVQRVIEGVLGILNKSCGYSFDKILFVGGNDILHVDTPRNTTTKGTPQDTDGMWYDNFLKAKQLYVDVIDILLNVADIHFVFNPSNHDYVSGFFLADVIKTHYRNCSQITFDCDISHRKYFTYGKNLIGTTHGDGAKNHDLPLLMATESKDWSSVDHRYFYTHHIHHKTSKDYSSVTVESFRSPSGADSYHHKNGYQHSPKAIESFIHHPKFGQVARINHIF